MLSRDVDVAGHPTAQASTSVASLEQVWATSDVTNTDSRIDYQFGTYADAVGTGEHVELVEQRRMIAGDRVTAGNESL